MESIYHRFNSYDFESNTNFQEGLRSIQENKGAENILKLKLFYYNRFVEPVDLEGYRQWSRCHKSQPVTAACFESCNLEGINQVTKPMGQSDHEQALLGSRQSEGNDSLSFADVLRLIQAGEEVPGIENLDIRPCQQTPTVSQLSRRLKPWERDNSGISMSLNE
ncbi:hypothetical protein AALO_G00051600 [Alosa alosa]|uniref:Uncharacterized protein n=1 Tax=Alosa alosa TaxID=278164 RepID=A0AAV6H9F9_9TELE|nr:hypothetical protein AALO_G00051600 [Alosa alosa]